MANSITRRELLTQVGAGAAALVLAACQPKVVEKIVKETVEKPVEKVVTQVVRETVIVEGKEKEITRVVEKVVTATPPPPRPTEVDRGPLKLMWLSQVALVEYFEGYNQRFAEKNNGAQVEIMVVPGGEFPQKLLSGIAAGDPPDMFREVNIANFAQFVVQGVILQLDTYIERDNLQAFLDTFVPGYVEAGQFKGKQYCIPWGAHTSSCWIFYNKTALDEKGYALDDRDWTWADYQELVRAVADPENKIYGSWIRSNYEGIVIGLRSLGTDIIDDTGTKSLIGTDQARPFFEMVDRLINQDGVTARPTEISDWKPPFAAGKIMLANDNGYRWSFLREMVEDFEFGMWLTPNEGDKPRGCVLTNLCPITSFSKHKDLAWEWIKGMLTVEESILRVEEGRQNPMPTPEAIRPKGVELNPRYDFYTQEWLADPPLVPPLPSNGRQTEIMGLVQRGFDEAWLGARPVGEVIDDVHAQLQSILGKPEV